MKLFFPSIIYQNAIQMWIPLLIWFCHFLNHYMMNPSLCHDRIPLLSLLPLLPVQHHPLPTNLLDSLLTPLDRLPTHEIMIATMWLILFAIMSLIIGCSPLINPISLKILVSLSLSFSIRPSSFPNGGKPWLRS